MSSMNNIVNTSGYPVPLYLTILSIVLGICSCGFGALNFIILCKMKENVNFGGFRFSSVVMLRNLVAADELRGVFLLTGMIRYLIIFYTNIGQDPQNPCDFDFYCTVQSFLSIWFNMITLICMLFIGIFAAYQISRGSGEAKVISDRILIYVSIACWIIPFLATLIPAFYGALGEDRSATTSGWCWITSCINKTSTDEKITFMILYSRGFETLIFLTNITLFIYLKIVTHFQDKFFREETYKGLGLSALSDIISLDSNTTVKNDSKLLFLINISICFCRLPGIVRTAIDIAMAYIIENNKYEIYLHKVGEVFLNFQAITDGVQSALVFGVLLICSRFAKAFLMKHVFRQRISATNI